MSDTGAHGQGHPGTELVPVVAYVRVSTDAQATDGAGLELQEQAIRAHAEGHGQRVTQVFTDAGVSGSEGLDKRLGLAEAMATLRAGDAAGLVVYRLDRLARDLMLQEQVLGEVWRLGAQVWSCSDAEGVYLRADDPADPSRKLIRQMLGAVAEYERSMIRLRLTTGQARKRAAGGYAGGGPPFGWKRGLRPGDPLLPIPAEQKVIARVVEIIEAGVPNMNWLAAVLNEEKLHPRGGGKWHRAQVERLVKRLERDGVLPRSPVVDA